MKNKALSDAMDAAKANGKSLHLMGLLSNGGVCTQPQRTPLRSVKDG